MKYTIEIEEGCRAFIEADDLEEALSKARTWVRDGDWGVLESIVTGTLTDAKGQEMLIDFLVGGPPAPDCAGNEEHVWRSPHCVVGGLIENPGVWGYGSDRLEINQVCARCGKYRTRITPSPKGSQPRIPQRTSYREADDKSLRWLSSFDAT